MSLFYLLMLQLPRSVSSQDLCEEKCSLVVKMYDKKKKKCFNIINLLASRCNLRNLRVQLQFITGKV